MKATLFLPNRTPVDVTPDGLSLADEATGFAVVSTKAAELLGCAKELVDVLASGPGYVVYSVFDHEGEINRDAMLAATKLTGFDFNLADEDATLRGPVLAVEKA